MDTRSTRLPGFPPLHRSPGAPDPLRECAEFQSILAGLGRELRSPLVSLRAGFDLILSAPETAARAQHVAQLQGLIGLCDELICMTDGYLGATARRPLLFGTYTLSAIVHDLDRECALAAAARGIHWTCRLEGPDGTITTDAARCQELLAHLVSSLLEASAEGRHVAVLARSEGAQVSLNLTDSGPLLAAEETPLALAPCQVLADPLGGRIAVSSEPGQGRCVTVYLPVDGPPGTAARGSRQAPGRGSS